MWWWRRAWRFILGADVAQRLCDGRSVRHCACARRLQRSPLLVVRFLSLALEVGLQSLGALVSLRLRNRKRDI